MSAPAGDKTLAGSLEPSRKSLSREGRLLLVSVVFDFFGRGLTIPYIVVYLRQVRHFSLGMCGLLVGLTSALGFIAAAPADP